MLLKRGGLGVDSKLRKIVNKKEWGELGSILGLRIYSPY